MRKFEIAKNLEKDMTWAEMVADDLMCGVEEAEEILMPEYGTKYSAGADFKCAQGVVIKSIWAQAFDHIFKKEPIVPTFVHTGIKVCMEEDEVLYLYNRSSGPLKKGVVLANSVGVVDADYYSNETDDGEIKFAFYNFFPFDIELHIGDKIGQGVFQKFLRAENVKIGGKRTGGYGSTGK